jgi:hypothetical protein
MKNAGLPRFCGNDEHYVKTLGCFARNDRPLKIYIYLRDGVVTISQKTGLKYYFTV